jgi:PAS domain S-box-containing protein
MNKSTVGAPRGPTSGGGNENASAHPAPQLSDYAESRYRLILESLPIALYTCDVQGRVQFYNHAAVALWGRIPEPNDRWCGSHRLYWPDGTAMELDQCPMATALREGRAVRGQEILIERPDGTRRYVLPYPDPLRDESSQLVGAVNMLVDVTDHRRAEEAQARLAAIVDSSDDAIVSKTLGGIITSWNAGAQCLFGYTPDEAIGQPITLIIPPERHDEEKDIIARLRRGERIDHYETVRVGKNGTPVNISLTISPVRDRSGRIIGASKIARDITARIKTEEALKEADRRKDEFLAMLAHELRNPLAPLRSGLQIMQMSKHRDRVMDQTREIMQRQVDHMVRLIDDLLDISRISRGKLELRRQRIPLESAIRVAVETCDPLVKQNGQSLTVSMSPEPIFIDADQIRISQALGNLLTNAAKFTPQGGKIWLTVQRQDKQAVIRIRDTGCGISSNMLDCIFDMFMQVDHTLQKSRNGLGIGLTLVKRLVEMHGGTVEAHSEGLGRGSEFVVRLPMVDSPVESRVTPSEPTSPSLPRKRVLVADDNRDAAECLAVMLEMMGSDVRTAHDGHEAVRLAESFRPELILLDIGMPGLSGYDAAKQIRQQEWGKQARLVALTGWGQEEDKHRSRQAGFDDHVVKPADPEALEKLLKE